MAVRRSEVQVAELRVGGDLFVDLDPCGLELAAGVVEVVHEEPDRAVVLGRIDAGVTVNDEPSGIEKRSASMPSTAETAVSPSTSRTNRVIAGRASVRVPTNVMPVILMGALPSIGGRSAIH